MWKFDEKDVEYKGVYEEGLRDGLTGEYTPDDNPYEDKLSRYYWSEGLFDGYKQYLVAQQQENNNVK